MENRFVYQFINQIIFRPNTLMIEYDEYHDFIVTKLSEIKFYEVLIDLSTLNNAKLEAAIFEFVLESEKRMQ